MENGPAGTGTSTPGAASKNVMADIGDVRLRRSAPALVVGLATGLFVAAIAAGAAPLEPPAQAAASRAAGVDPCDVSGVNRVVAVADVHGAYDQFVAILRAAGIIDADGRWAGGQTHFVQTGDLVDRGPATRKVLDLMMRLEREAPKAGGRVYALLGNHEVLAMLGDVRYASPEEYEEFRTPDSEAVRELYYERMVTDKRNGAKASGQPLDEATFRREFLKRVPLGFVERQVAFGPKGEYGKWLRQHDTMVRINQVVFVHGGISPSTAELGCAAINERVRAELTTDFDKMLAAQERSLIAGPDGPLWYRGLADLDGSASAAQIDSVLAKLNARAMIGGHTVVAGGRIQVRFGGKVFQIDTGMLSSEYAGGRASALEIRDGTFTAIYVDGRERLSTSHQQSPTPELVDERGLGAPPHALRAA
jgi:hypothetical protein